MEPRIADGFPGQRMRVLPRPLVAEALRQPMTRYVLATDAGYFPHAAHHWRQRAGVAETIIIYCANGRGLCRVGEEALTITAGQVLVIPPRVAHRYEADADDPWSIWWVHVTGSHVREALEVLGVQQEPLLANVAEPTRIATLLDTILRRLEVDESSDSLVGAAGAAWHLLSVLVADRRTLSRRGSDPIGAVRAHLQENLASHVRVADLAAMAGFSASHFSALFRRSTGFGVVEYQTRLRMSLARQLLDTTDQTVAAIARQVGYDDPMYFSRQFRRIHTISPTQYRSGRQPASGTESSMPDV